MMGIVNRKNGSGVLGQVLAPWWRWPLYSPRRLITVALVVVSVIFGVARFAAARSDTPAAPSPVASTLPVPSVPSVPTRSAPIGPAPVPSVSSPAGGVSVNVPARARDVAGEFVRLWARPGVPQRQWYAELSAFATVQLAGPLSFSDPRLVPATAVTSPPKAVEMSPNGQHPTSVTFLVGTDAGVMRVRADMVRTRWLVGGFEPADTFYETD